MRIGVALRVDGRCGELTHELPGLVHVEDLAPGDSTAPVGVCVSSLGTARARLFLSAVDVTSAEAGCTGDEAAVDASCGSGQGELDRVLAVGLAVQKQCKGAFGPELTVPFADLAQQPVEVPAAGGPGRVDCLTLRLRYAATSTPDSVAAQSDRVTWRYAFDLVSAVS